MSSTRLNWFQIACLITLRPRQDGRHFPDDTFKRIFLNGNVIIPIKISLKFVPKGPINNIPALVQIMTWRRPGDKPLSEAMMVSLLTYICVTRPQWVNSWSVAMSRDIYYFETVFWPLEVNLNSLMVKENMRPIWGHVCKSLFDLDMDLSAYIWYTPKSFLQSKVHWNFEEDTAFCTGVLNIIWGWRHRFQVTLHRTHTVHNLTQNAQ